VSQQQMDETGETEPREVIRRVPTNQRSVVLLLAMGLLGFWLGAVNLGFSDMAGRWLVRQLGWVANPENSTIYFAIGMTAVVLSFVFWLFNGARNTAYEISASGISVFSFGGKTLYRWSDFYGLERNVGTIVLFLANPEPGLFGTKTVVFDLAAIDWTSTELEALIVYHRPDLFSAQSQFSRKSGVPVAA
jgi:hypothetical protein